MDHEMNKCIHQVSLHSPSTEPSPEEIKRIIIFGFPHCGTTILRSIIGHIEEVEEILGEKNEINDKLLKQVKDKKYILCKDPNMNTVFFSDKYKEYIKIFIVRNPLWVFSSLNKRFLYKINNDVKNSHSIKRYIKTLGHFHHYLQHPQENLYLIRYEDIFDNHYQVLKNIFNQIGFSYTDQIFKNEEYENKKTNMNEKIPSSKPKDHIHELYRLYQINLPFVCQNYMEKIDLLQEQIDEIGNNEIIQVVYPEVKTIIPMIKPSVTKSFTNTTST